MRDQTLTFSERNLSLDALRISAAFTVVLLHAASRVVALNADVYDENWWVGNFIDSFSRWCVPAFIMISGTLLLSKEIKIWAFYRKRVAKLGPIIIFWTVFYALIDGYRGENFEMPSLLFSIAVGVPHYHLWFLFMIFGLYLATPFIRRFVEAADLQMVGLFSLFCFFISSIESVWSVLFKVGGGSTFISSFLPFIGYFVAGYYYQKTEARITLSKLFLLWVTTAVSIALIVGLLFPLINQKAWEIMYSYNNPLVIIMSLCVFLIFIRSDIRSQKGARWVKNIAPFTLGIYVIHPIWLAVFSKLIYLPFVGIPLTSILVFFLSLGSVFVLSKVPWFKMVI